MRKAGLSPSSGINPAVWGNGNGAKAYVFGMCYRELRDMKGKNHSSAATDLIS